MPSCQRGVYFEMIFCESCGVIVCECRLQKQVDAPEQPTNETDFVAQIGGTREAEILADLRWVAGA